MFDAWIHWLSSMRPGELILLLLPLLIADVTRYCLTGAFICLHDALRDWLHSICGLIKGSPYAVDSFDYCPTVCVVLAGLNEADTLESTMESVWDTYPKLELIVVDDGSTDEMTQVANAFARLHPEVQVVRKPTRGGKSSALNCAIPLTTAEILICVDTDSHLMENAIWEIVQPFKDPKVGAAGGAVIARNGHENLCASLQAAEYLRTIFIGRIVASRLGVLGIVSGAFGAFRREALERAKGWDVGPGEDGDLVMRMRKSGWKVKHVPYAQCLTNLPLKWKPLFKQRRRWEWSVVTFECRKHIDMANPFTSNFQVSNFAMVFERWLYSIVFTFSYIGYLIWLLMQTKLSVGFVLFTIYIAYVFVDLVQWMTILYYSPKPSRDIRVMWTAPFMPFYYLFLKMATLVAIIEEALWRRSFADNFVPERVRRVTWHW